MIVKFRMKVKFSFYKASGKMYSEEITELYVEHLDDAWEQARKMLESGSRPGLVNGYNFHCVVTCPFKNEVEPNGLSRLFIRGIHLYETKFQNA